MTTEHQNRPNVVVFFTDQQRWDSTGVHGNPLDLTPNFDRLAQQGVHFANTFSAQPVCGPSRACLQTGTYQNRHGVFYNNLPLPRDATTLAHCFRDADYDTGYIGKWHLGDPYRMVPEHGPVPVEERGGYEYWLGANGPELISDAYDAILYDQDDQPVKLPGYRVDAVTDAAIRYIDLHQTQRFYLFVSYLEPHMQNTRDDYPAPDGYAERYVGRWMPADLAALGGNSHKQIAGYWGMVKRLDEALGRLLDVLKSLHLLDNTIVVFTSDHGCHFRTRNRSYKRSCHESSIRVPLAIWGPGLRGRRIEQLFSLIDLPSTLLDAVGLPIPEPMQGHSAMPLVRGETGAWQEEVFVQISDPEMGRAVRTRRWKYCVSDADKDPRGQISSSDYKEKYLYDLMADPYELNNLIGLESHREVSEVMRRRLVRRMVEAGEEAPEIKLAPSRPGGLKHVTTEEAHS